MKTKITRILILGLLSIFITGRAEITEDGWFNAQDPGIETGDAELSIEEPSIPSTNTPPPQIKSKLALPPQDPAAIAEVITPEIQALASGLQNDWAKIYSYVHDHIRYVHYYGSKKGAQLTLLEKSGNDFDQCALLMALLRSAGYTNSTYGFGWMGIPFDDPTGSGNDLHHWWQLNFSNTNSSFTSNYVARVMGSRGYPYYLPNGTNEFVFQRVWVNMSGNGNSAQLDPAFKVYRPITGISLTNAMGFTSNAVMSAAGGTNTANYVTNLNETALNNTLTAYTTNLLNYIQNNSPNASVEEILGGQKIDSSLTYGLQFPVYSFTVNGRLASSTNWSYIPTNLMSKLTIKFAGTNYQTWIPQLQGQRLALTFGTTGQAQLWKDDALMVSNTASGSAAMTNVVVTFNHPAGVWNFTNSTLTRKGYFDDTVTNSYQRTNATYALLYAFEPDWGWLKQRHNQLDAYRLQGLGDNSREVVSETLNIMGLNWMLQTEKMIEMTGTQMKMLPAFYHRFGRMAQENGNGYYIDVYEQLSSFLSASGSSAANITRVNDYFDVHGYFASALEHGIIEQLQSSNLVASSTVKMLQIANANGQAVYIANSGNWSTVQNKLANYDSFTLSSIGAAVNSGYSIMLPQNGSNHVAGAGSWAGYGYAARRVTSTNEDLAMRIAGLYHGGYSAYWNYFIDTPYVSLFGQSQPNSFLSSGSFNFGSGLTIADPIDAADGTFQVEQTDLAIGQPEPKGITLSRYYNGTRRNSNPAGMAGGWIHNYYINAATVSAPQAGFGGTTPAQAAPMLTATCAALNTYSGSGANPKNWLVTALIAKWAVDQLSHNSVSIIMGKDTVQFVKQPNGAFTPPANCTMTLTQSGGNFALQQRHGNTFNFDSGGRLGIIVDPYNNSLSVAYLSSTSSLPQTVTDWKGRALTFNYTGKQLTSVSDNSTPGRTVNYGFSSTNTQADLTSFTDAEGKTGSYAYDDSHQIIATFDALSRLVVSNVYDGFGHVAAQYTQGDTNKAWQIFWSGWQTVMKDPAGNQQSYFYDDRSQITTFIDELFNFRRWSYDGQGHVITNTSPLSEITRQIYDGNHNVVQTIDPLGFTNQFVFDSQKNMVRSVDPRGIPSTFGYNAQFSLTGATNGAGDFVNYAFNTDGTPQSRTDSGGMTTFDSFDTYGQLTHITYPNGLGAESFVNSFVGDVTSHTDGNGNTTTFGFNNRRQMTNSVAPTNRITKIAFDPVGNKASVTDARGFVTSNTWSATRNVLTTTLPAMPQGVPVITNAYDNRDWLIKTVDPLQRATLFTNDAAGRLISQTDPLLRKTSLRLDANGRKLASTNAAQIVTRQTWDKRGKLLTLTDGANHVSSRVYDAAGNQTTLTNRNGKKWQFQFDGANRATNTITPLGRSSSVMFNNRGLVSATKDAANQTSTLLYDAKKRLTSRADNVGTTAYGFDANDNPASVVENGLTNAFTYDAYNQVSSYKDVYGNLIQYRQDANGNVTNLVYPGGKNVYYAFDSNNHLTNVTDWSGRKTAITCDLAGQITSITRPNGTYRTIGFDAGGQATNILEQMGNTLPIAWFKFNWTNTGNMAWEFAAPLPHAATVPTRNMTYDDDNRLATFNGSPVYSDANGNLTNAPLTNATLFAHVYDARNRLRSAGGVTNVYDAMNNRIGQQSGTNVTTFVVNPNAKLPQVLMRVKNGVTNYYIYGVGLLYQITETATATNTLTYHYDFRGSTVALTDDSGKVTDRVEYSAYGLTTYRTGTNDTPFLFNGRYGVMTDPNGLLYMRNRYYNPYLCRFISADPSGFSGGLNWYAFAGGNPVSFLDPFGLNAQATGDTYSSWVNRGWGALGALGGGLTASFGYTFGTVTAPTVAGGVAGAVIGTYGLDMFQAGIRQMWTGENTPTMLNSGLQDLGMSPTAATWTSAGIGVALTGGASIYSAYSAVNSIPSIASTEGNTISLYHQGFLANGVSATRPFSTSLSSDLSHYNPGASLNQFNVPQSTLNQWLGNGSAREILDLHAPSGIITSEIRILPPASAQMNQFLFIPTP